jgi:divalent metal cation (Fe/Co/Zn/Cd) transporter
LCWSPLVSIALSSWHRLACSCGDYPSSYATGKCFPNAPSARLVASAALLFLLAAYVTAAAMWHLWNGTGEEFSWPGFIVALIAIPAMRYLAHRKIAIAEKIGSRALRADAMEAVTCGWLSFVVVVSFTTQWLVGASWIDGVGSLAIVYFLVKEGREAWSGDECESCCA